MDSSEMPKTSLIYIKNNKDWECVLKYGHTSNKDDALVKRKFSSFEEHSHKTEYIALFEITELPGCNFYKEKDKLISILGRNLELINAYEYKYQIQLTNLKEFNINQYHVDNGGGKEFMKREGLETFKKIITEDFPKLLLEVREYTKEEVDKENEKERVKSENKREKYNTFIMDLLGRTMREPFIIKHDIKPLEVQKNVLDNITNFYENNNIGKLVWACGLGKALCSLLICNKLECKSILIGVPSRNLVNQFVREAKKIYNPKYILGIGSDDELTTNREQITTFMKDNESKIIITTYHSCHIIKKLCDDNNYRFDFKIGDECHHLAGNKSNDREDITQFKKFHFIPSKKTLFMTATERNVEDYNSKEGFSMDNIEQFGDYIDKKSTHWAIENNKITDYKLGIYKNTEAQVDQIINSIGIKVKNKELFLSAFIALKVMTQEEKLTHVLIYANKTVNADLINKYIEQIIDKKYLNINKEDLYHKSLHSNMYSEGSTDMKLCFNITNEVDKFKSAKLGIISCVQIFGEGFDLPKLNGVVIAESMDSEIRIVQSSLRPHRLEDGNDDKVAFVMCPFIDKINYRDIEKDESYKKIKQLLFHLRNTDEEVISRMKLYDYSFHKSDNERESKIPEYITNEKELEIFRIFCRSSISLGDTAELDEYEFVRGLNDALQLDTKQKYYERQKEHPYFVEEPEQHFRGLWKNWYHYLKIDTGDFIQNKNDWKKRCNELGINSLEKYKNMSSNYSELPGEPGEFYLGFSHIEAELNERTTRRRRF
jgi:superfamily II DNA or RNA helicase